LHERVWRQTRAARGRDAAQLLPGADNVYRRGVFGFTSPVRDGEGQTVHLQGARVVARLVPEQAEERNPPGVPGDTGGEICVGQALQAVLKYLPQRPGIGEDGRDLVGEVAPASQAEVGGLLPGEISGQKLVQHVRPEQAAFNTNCGERRHNQTTGWRTRSPSTSGGSWGTTVSSRTRSATAWRTRL
jgi:hypothetical protein